MATARGVVTVTDIADGLPTISIIQTNENHSFTAASDGSVEASERTAFRNNIAVLVGDTQAGYVTSTPTVNNTFTIGTLSVTPSGDITPRLGTDSLSAILGTGNIIQAAMVIDAIADDARDVQVRLPIIVRRLGVNVTLIAIVTFSKAIGGSAQSVQVEANRRQFVFTSSAATTSTDEDIVLTATGDGNTGDFTWTRSVDAGTSEPVPAGQISGTNNNTVTIPDTDFASANNITYRASRGTAADRVSIFRINEIQPFYIVPRVTSGALDLKNNEGTVTIVADVYEGGNEISSYSGWTFTWNGPPANDADGTRITLTSSVSGITLANLASGVNRQITISATSYIQNNMAHTLNISATNPNA